VPDIANYSGDYTEARDRFCQAAACAGFVLSSHPLAARGPKGEALTIDVASRLHPGARATLVVSSGTHGVEGYFGSAVQLAALSGPSGALRREAPVNVVLVHAVNPYGFAHARRVNEDEVDLNRNFVLPGQPFRGAHPFYSRLDSLLNPQTPPPRFDPFLAQAAIQVLRHGFSAMKNAVAQGQYDFPRGLFYGGAAPTASAQVIAALAPGWAAGTERVLHLDLHTGLGKPGRFALCVDLPSGSPRVERLCNELGRQHVQGFDTSGVLYEIRGSLSRFLDRTITHASYDCILAEFGTIPTLDVLLAMRFERRVALFAARDQKLKMEARDRMLAAFCPQSETWRATALKQGHALVGKALHAMQAV
jgi:hypothetical protein